VNPTTPLPPAVPTPTPTPLALVVIPTLNEARHVEAVLARLREGLPADHGWRFVVADGGSDDGTVEIVQRLARADRRLHLLPNPGRLQSAGINLAVERFGADAAILVRCDAHAEYPPGYVGQLVASLEAHGADAVVVPMDSLGQSCVGRAIAWVSDTPVGSGGSAHRAGRRSGFVDHGHHAAFRMSSFRRAGGYDVSMMANEDAELDCRQRKLGSRIFLDAAIRIGYHPRDSLARLWRQYFSYGRGRSRTVRRHPESLRLRQFAVPAHIGLCVLALLASPWLPWLALWPGAYLLALAGTSVALAVRHRSPCGLLGGPAAFVMHVSWAFGFAQGLLTVREMRWQPDAPAGGGSAHG